jgi:hypothetical protein
MGYLTDNVSIRSGVAECPLLYPYEMIVEYALNDPFHAPNAVDVMGLAIREVLPDVEEWQLSVMRRDEKRVKYRFRTESQRNQASNAITAMGFTPGPVAIKQVVFQNAPDRATRGIA